MKTDILCLRISNGALAAEKLPTRLKVLNWGVNNTVKGPVSVGDHTLAVFAANQKDTGFDRVALDYEHNTLPGTAAFLADKEPRKVAAYGTPRVIAGDGIYLEDMEWTPAGKEFAREYIDLSPAVKPENGEVVFMHSTALCRQGAVEDLHFYSVEIPPKADPPMADNTNKKEIPVDHKKQLIALLALNADATDDQIFQAWTAKVKADAEALTALTAQVKDLATKITAFSVDPQSTIENRKSEIGNSVVALTAKVAVLEGNVTAFNAELAKRDRAALVDQAGREGKVIPLTAEQIGAMPIDMLRDMIVKLPATVPITALTAGGIREQHLGNVITENDKKIAAACGIKLKETK
jgi:hypothetical protein